VISHFQVFYLIVQFLLLDYKTKWTKSQEFIIIIIVIIFIQVLKT